MKFEKISDWVGALNQDTYEALVDRKGWLIVFVCSSVGLTASAYAPIVGAFFQLQLFPVLLCMVPVSICALLISNRRLRQSVSVTQTAVLMLVTSASFQFFLWSMVCFSSPSGAPVMAAFPILLASYHGQFFQISFPYPYGALSILGGVFCALLMAQDSSYLAIILLGGSMALAAATVMGDIERRGAALKKEHGALKAAVDAQILLDQTNEIEEAKILLKEVRGTNHDANNALSGILFNLQYLINKTRGSTQESINIPLVNELAEDISDSIERLKTILEKGRDVGKGNAAVENVILSNVISDSSRLLRQKYPNVHFEIEWLPPELAKGASISLFGGAVILQRIVTNLLFNAAEGNGHLGASAIHLSVKSSNDNTILIEIEDDGPGFHPEQLKNIGDQLQTTKANGSGLGLYTTRRLIRANNGQLVIQNRDIVGAIVSVKLPTRLGLKPTSEVKGVVSESC